MTSISYLNESERSSISVLRVSILPLHVYTVSSTSRLSGIRTYTVSGDIVRDSSAV
jgi:hypothetical protein